MRGPRCAARSGNDKAVPASNHAPPHTSKAALDGLRCVRRLMGMRSFLAPLTLPFALFAISGCAFAIAGDDPSTKPATEAAQAWLKLEDAGAHDKAWEEAASFFKS